MNEKLLMLSMKKKIQIKTKEKVYDRELKLK